MKEFKLFNNPLYNKKISKYISITKNIYSLPKILFLAFKLIILKT